MKSFEEIRSKYNEFAASISLEGIVIDKLCTLLAYSTYKNQILQLEDTLEKNFSTCTKLNSRIFHASNLMYSVPRGKCPIMHVKNIRVAETRTVNYLDQALYFNGYYFYYAEGADFNVEDQLREFDLICSTKALGTEEKNVSSDFFCVEFSNLENVSSDYKIIEVGNTENVVNQSRITEDPSKLYEMEEIDDEWVYIYDYLVTTIPSYGIKITRRANTQGWGENGEATKLRVEYVAYSETTPDITTLTSMPGFVYVDEGEESLNPTKTSLILRPFVERLSDKDKIYSNATASFVQQNSVATEQDLLIYLSKYNDESAMGTYKIYSDTEITRPSTEIVVSPNALVTTLVYSGVDGETVVVPALEKFVKEFSVPKEIQTYKATGVNFDGFLIENQQVYVEAFPKSKELTNTELANICNSYHSMIGEKLTHAKFEADIVKLGFDYVKVYVDAAGTTELTADVTPEIYQYPEIFAIVKT